MSEINLKLKSYDELIFEITKLNTNNYLLKQRLEAYENMRKEAIEYCNSYHWWTDEGGNFQESDFCIDDLLNILNKVGGSDE